MMSPAVRHVLVECGDYQCSNMGDVAMLQVTVQRLRERFPSASIGVITQDPQALAHHCPEAVPVSYDGRCVWLERGALIGRLDRVLRRTPPFRAHGLEDVLRRHCAPLLELLLRARLPAGDTREAFFSFMMALHAADAVVVCGAGGITDHARNWATPVLALLEYAASHGKATAMFGHGLGPLTDRDLRRMAARVLPRLDILALREGRSGPALARALGVDETRIVVTGDDAIELAYARRPASLGGWVGINLRVARSSGVDESYIDPVGAVLRRFAAAVGAPLLPLPIGRGRASNDVVTMPRLLGRVDTVNAIGPQLDTTRSVIEQAGRCRIVVTGAYHAAVFALSQGVPTICLARSDYFTQKLLGLAAQFQGGCTVIDLGEPDFPQRLEHAMHDVWDAAPVVRPTLLDLAARQIADSRGAYLRFSEMSETPLASRRGVPAERTPHPIRPAPAREVPRGPSAARRA